METRNRMSCYEYMCLSKIPLLKSNSKADVITRRASLRGNPVSMAPLSYCSYKRAPRELTHPFCYVKTYLENAIYERESEYLSDTECASTLILVFSASRIMTNKFPLFSSVNRVRWPSFPSPKPEVTEK